MKSSGTPWYTALRTLDFPSYAKALDGVSLSEPTVPYVTANVLARSPLYEEAVAHLPRKLVDEMTVVSWYVLFMLTEQMKDPAHATERAVFRREAQKYFHEKGVNVGEWWDVMQKALRLVHSA